MKRIILILIAMIGITFVNSSFTTLPKHKVATIKKNKKAKFNTVNVTATNSTSDGVHVTLQNTTSGGAYYFFIPPNTPNGIVLGQIPEGSDVYTVGLTSTGGAHNMWIYWEHQSNVTGLSASGMALGCQSCAQIKIF